MVTVRTWKNWCRSGDSSGVGGAWHGAADIQDVAQLPQKGQLGDHWRRSYCNNQQRHGKCSPQSHVIASSGGTSSCCYLLVKFNLRPGWLGFIGMQQSMHA